MTHSRKTQEKHLARMWLYSLVPCRTGSRTGTWDWALYWRNKLRARIIFRARPLIFLPPTSPYPPPSRLHILCTLLLATDRIQYMGTQPRTLPAQWRTEEIYRHKRQGIWCIKQGLDRNQTEIRRSKITNIYYNTVMPCYIKWGLFIL